MIVSRDDFPLFEMKIDSLVKNQNKVKPEQYEFIINGALDTIDQLQWQTKAMYLKPAEKFNDCLSVACLLTPANTRLVLLHEAASEDRIKTFLNEVYDLYARLAMNPFFSHSEKINITQFNQRVAQHAARLF